MGQQRSRTEKRTGCQRLVDSGALVLNHRSQGSVDAIPSTTVPKSHLAVRVISNSWLWSLALCSPSVPAVVWSNPVQYVADASIFA